MASETMKYKVAALKTGNILDQLVIVFDEVLTLLHQGQQHLKTSDSQGQFAKFDKVFLILKTLKQGIDYENADENSMKALESLDDFIISVMAKIPEITKFDAKSEEVEELIESITKVRDTIKDKIKELATQ